MDTMVLTPHQAYLLDRFNELTVRVPARFKPSNLYKAACAHGKWKPDYDKANPPEDLKRWYVSACLHLPMWTRKTVSVQDSDRKLTLDATQVSIEHLQDPFFRETSKENPIYTLAEMGVELCEDCVNCVDCYGYPCCFDEEGECGMLDDTRSDYADSWDAALPEGDRDRYSWGANPLVFVLKLKKSKEAEPAEH